MAADDRPIEIIHFVPQITLWFYSAREGVGGGAAFEDVNRGVW